MERRQLLAFSELPSRTVLGDLGFSGGASAAAGTRWAGSRHSFLRGSFPGPSMSSLLGGSNPEWLTADANSILPAPPAVSMKDHRPAGGLSVWTLADQNTPRGSAVWCGLA